MNYNEILDRMVEDGNGYLLTSQVVSNGINKTALAAYVKNRKMERVGHGLYLAQDEWADELFQISILNQRAVFSHETALHLHGLMEREPTVISVTVPAGYNATHLRRRGLRVYQVKLDVAELGIVMAVTGLGNEVRTFDMERTICDLISCKEEMDVQVFQYAMKEYMASKHKNLGNLMLYAKRFQMEAVVRLYTEVML